MTVAMSRKRSTLKVAAIAVGMGNDVYPIAATPCSTCPRYSMLSARSGISDELPSNCVGFSTEVSMDKTDFALTSGGRFSSQNFAFDTVEFVQTGV